MAHLRAGLRQRLRQLLRRWAVMLQQMKGDALHSLRQRKPARLICAVPVASHEALALVRPLADEVACLQAPQDFEAVGQYYEDFTQVEDDEVIQILSK